MRWPTVYEHPYLYELAMRALYGRHFASRYQAIAVEIPSNSSVLDVCCGDCALYFRCLEAKSVRYVGLDRSERMISRALRSGLDARVADLETCHLPDADTVVMQASLYHFLPDPTKVVKKLLRAARGRLLIAEPIVNLSSSGSRWIAELSRRVTNADPVLSASGVRFNRAQLKEFFRSFPEFERSFHVPGGRECVGIFRGQALG